MLAKTLRLIGAVFISAGLSSLLLCGCTAAVADAPAKTAARLPQTQESSGSVDAQVARLLDKYGLTASGPAKVHDLQMPAIGSLPLTLYVEGSKGIGLDPTPWAGRKVKVHAVPLKQKTLDGGVTAYFLVGDGSIVGAYLGLEGYTPGVVSMDDKSYFAPPKFTPSNLDFTGVERVRVVGPWNGSDWERESTVATQAASDLLGMVANSRRSKGERSGQEGDEEYMLVITYASGAEVRARLTTKRDGTPTFLTFDAGPFSGWYYTPPSELKPLVKSLLGT